MIPLKKHLRGCIHSICRLSSDSLNSLQKYNLNAGEFIPVNHFLHQKANVPHFSSSNNEGLSNLPQKSETTSTLPAQCSKIDKLRSTDSDFPARRVFEQSQNFPGRTRPKFIKQGKFVTEILEVLKPYNFNRVSKPQEIMEIDDSELKLLLRPWENKVNKYDISEIIKEISSPVLSKKIFYWAGSFANVEKDRPLYNTMITNLGKARDFEGMEEIFGEMIASNTVPNTGTFNAMIDSYGKAALFDKAESTRDRMRSLGISPDIITVNSLLDAYGKAGRLPDVQRMWGCLEDYGIVPDVPLYSTLIVALGKSNQIEMAERTWEEVKAKGLKPSLTLYNVMIALYRKVNKVKEAEALWAQIRTAGLKPSVISYGAMIDLYLKSEQYTLAQRLYREMQAEGISPSPVVQTMMVQLYFKIGEIWKARALFSQMVSSGCYVSVVTWTAIIDLYGKAGKRTEALGLFQEMIKRGVVPSNRTYTVIIDMCGKGGMFEEVEAIFEKMLEYSIPPDSILLSTIVANLGKYGCTADAARWFQELVTVHKVVPNVPCYTALMYAYLNSGLYRESSEVYRAMIAKGLEPSLLTYSQLLSALSSCKDEESTKEILKIMEGQKPHRILSLILGENGGGSWRIWGEIREEFQRLKREKLEERKALANAIIGFLNKLDRKLEAKKIWEIVSQYWSSRVTYNQRYNLWKLDLHGLSESTVQLAVLSDLNRLRWLALAGENEVKKMEKGGGTGGESSRKFPHKVRIVTGWGKRSRVPGLSVVRDSIQLLLEDLGSPFQREGEGSLEADGPSLKIWLLRQSVGVILRKGWIEGKIMPEDFVE